MIQRIQTIFLLAAVAFIGVNLILPLYQASIPEIGDLHVGVYKSYITDINGEKGSEDSNWYGIVLMVISIALSSGAIFLFNNRPLQARIARLGIVINLGLLVALVYVTEDGMALFGELAPKSGYNYPAFALPILAALSCFLASRAIIKDETLVRSADRLR